MAIYPIQARQQHALVLTAVSLPQLHGVTYISSILRMIHPVNCLHRMAHWSLHRHTGGRRTGQQEGGAVGAPLAPEGGEEVDELEHVDAAGCGQRVIPNGGDVKQHGHPEKAKQLDADSSKVAAIHSEGTEIISH